MCKMYIFKLGSKVEYSTMKKVLPPSKNFQEGDQRLRTNKNELAGFQQTTVFQNSRQSNLISAYFDNWEMLADKFSKKTSRFEQIEIYNLMEKFSPGAKIIVLDTNKNQKRKYKRICAATKFFYSLQEGEREIWIEEP